MTPTWLEHATFWSGVRRATIAPQGLMGKEISFGVVVAKAVWKFTLYWDVIEQSAVS